MSEAKFPRETVMNACRKTIASLNEERSKRVAERESALKDYLDQEAKKSWWSKSDNSFEEFMFEDQIETAGKHGVQTEKRIQQLLNFCEILSTDEVTLSVNEFADISNYY